MICETRSFGALGDSAFGAFLLPGLLAVLVFSGTFTNDLVYDDPFYLLESVHESVLLSSDGLRCRELGRIIPARPKLSNH